ncbi:LysR substrate-binding domain-containing protein [Rubrolithibacter danxiaensis]|uniref:LysR substrate-binding domain-containing protein n=1 Tax=Rubrolithibacter danxiaensis TaxID=3390805 RepID=UPI003BF87CC8
MLSVSHEVFFEVASHLSFSKAAQVLYISQPAISKHIKMLESMYKSSLFERKGNSIQLTPTGEILFKHLKEAKQIQRNLEFDISTFQKEANAVGALHLGSSTIITLYILPQILSGFHKQYPNIDIQVVNRNSESILDALLDHQIDLGIVEVEKKLTSVTYQHFTSDEIIPVCSVNSPIARKPVITLDELLRLPVALRERGSGTLSALARELQKENIRLSDLNAKVKLHGTEALKNFVLVDTCIGFLSKRSVLKQLELKELVELTVEGLNIKREFFFIRRHGTEDFGLTKQFIRYALSSL